MLSCMSWQFRHSLAMLQCALFFGTIMVRVNNKWFCYVKCLGWLKQVTELDK